MKLVKLLCCGMMLASVGVWAQTPKDKLVEEMLVLSGTPETLKNLPAQIMQMQTGMINQQSGLTPEKKEKLLAFQKKIMQKVMDVISWEKMKNDYIALYADVYSEEELTALINFLKSPVGQKMMQKNPQLMQNAMAMMQQKMQKLAPELEKMGKEFAEEMREEQAPETPAVVNPAPAVKTEEKK